ncbi:AglZ/HisF2 family acetamidino modification protein [Brucella sp. IR073]|uniref:AglZ/HisF2 family acetamidino modification protein n=1 Tax=unclassified Brucella TaxID=2632610 RepID=UPI003B97EFB5
MLLPRVIPTLLLKGSGLVKTVQFKNPTYIGDPINAIKIFNDKGVDELVLLDITASQEKREPSFEIIAKIADECFMPLAYGGGVTSIEQVKRIFGIGIEKVVINSAALTNPQLITDIAREFGSQAVVVAIDVRRKLFGRYEVVTARGAKGTGLDPQAYARQCEQAGAGEILLTAVDRDGTMTGYDHALIASVSKQLSIPLIASGGAKDLADFAEAVNKSGAAAVAGGAIFVFQGKHRGVLITYPDQNALFQSFNASGIS